MVGCHSTINSKSMPVYFRGNAFDQISSMSQMDCKWSKKTIWEFKLSQDAIINTAAINTRTSPWILESLDPATHSATDWGPMTTDDTDWMVSIEESVTLIDEPSVAQWWDDVQSGGWRIELSWEAAMMALSTEGEEGEQKKVAWKQECSSVERKGKANGTINSEQGHATWSVASSYLHCRSLLLHGNYVNPAT